MLTQKQIEAAYEELKANEVFVNHDEVERALEAAEAAAWQQIKTAPKDGSLIFLWNELWDGCCGPIICWWDDTHDCWTTYTTTIKKWADQPTRWRPLPAAPTAADADPKAQKSA